MLKIDTTFSSKVIRRGDAYNIIVKIQNFTDDDVTLTKMRIGFQPGFFVNEGATARSELTQFGNQLNPFSPLDTTKDIVINEKITKGSETTKTIHMKAGRIIGFRPRPDEYNIAITAFYTSSDGGEKSQNIEVIVRVYASLPGMLAGTIFGSFIGNMMTSEFNFDVDKTPFEILTSIVIGFMAGIILMRRKDVQAFITIEDFWGGILIGFTVGIVGKEAIFSMLKTGTILPDITNSTIANVTSVQGN